MLTFFVGVAVGAVVFTSLPESWQNKVKSAKDAALDYLLNSNKSWRTDDQNTTGTQKGEK